MPASERMARLRGRQRADHRLLLALLADRAGRRLAHKLVAATPDLAAGVSDAVTDALRPVTDVSDAPSLHARTNGSADVRGYGALVTSSPTEKRENENTTDFEQVRCVLEPLRGYAHDEQLLQRLAATCPAVDLVLEAIGMAEWLNRTANRKRTCSKAFLSNWVKRAATKPVGRTDPQRAAPAAQEPRSALGRVLEQIATNPVEGPSTWR